MMGLSPRRSLTPLLRHMSSLSSSIMPCFITVRLLGGGLGAADEMLKPQSGHQSSFTVGMDRGSSHRLPVNTAHHLYALRVKLKKKPPTSDSTRLQGLAEWRRLNTPLPRLLLLETHLLLSPLSASRPPLPHPINSTGKPERLDNVGFFVFCFCQVPRLSLHFQGAASQIEVSTSSHYDRSEGQEVSAGNSAQGPVTAAPAPFLGPSGLESRPMGCLVLAHTSTSQRSRHKATGKEASLRTFLADNILGSPQVCLKQKS